MNELETLIEVQPFDKGMVNCDYCDQSCPIGQRDPSDQGRIDGDGMSWEPIDTAPKGSGMDGPDSTRHPDYISPPRILLCVRGEVVIGRYDWFYHEGYGRGSGEQETPWCGDEGVCVGFPTHWMPLPSPPL